MVLKVLDEADIIEDNLRYHRAQGVDSFVVTDTGSSDGTVEILERYQRAGIVRLERIGRSIQDMREGGQTAIARIAHETGADWVIHNDADEFWWPLTCNLKETLAAIPDRFGIVLAPRADFVVRPDGESSFADRLTVRERRFLRPPKTAHRAHPQVVTWGAHPIQLWVDTGHSPRRGMVGKPIRRTKAAHVEEHPLELVLAPTFPVGVLHFPFRSFEQYRRRAEIAIANEQLSEGNPVRTAYEGGRLEEIYARLTLDDDAVAGGIEEGWLVEDTAFRDCLRACPDPLAADAAGRAPSPCGEPGGPDSLPDLEADAMYALSRYLQAFAYKGSKEGRRKAARRAASGGN